MEYFVSYYYKNQNTLIGFGCGIITAPKFDLAEIKKILDEQNKGDCVPINIIKVMNLK